MTEPTDAEREARMFHEAYERLAPSFGYETRSGTREFDPASPNGKLMVAVCGELQSSRTPTPVGVEPVAWRVRRLDSPNYWIIFLHKPVDALMDPKREVQPLYTAQALAMGRVPLDGEQIEAAAVEYCVDDFLDFQAGVKFAERHHGVKGGQHVS